MRTTARYISLDDVKTFLGIDLEAELKEGATRANLFLLEQEDRIIDYIRKQSWTYFDDAVWNRYSDEQKEAFRKAVMYQVNYILYNGDLANDSGIDPETGVRVTPDQFALVAIAPRSIECLKAYGLVSLVMRGRW